LPIVRYNIGMERPKESLPPTSHDSASGAYKPESSGSPELKSQRTTADVLDVMRQGDPEEFDKRVESFIAAYAGNKGDDKKREIRDFFVATQDSDPGQELNPGVLTENLGIVDDHALVILGETAMVKAQYELEAQNERKEVIDALKVELKPYGKLTTDEASDDARSERRERLKRAGVEHERYIRDKYTEKKVDPRKVKKVPQTEEEKEYKKRVGLARGEAKSDMREAVMALESGEVTTDQAEILRRIGVDVAEYGGRVVENQQVKAVNVQGGEVSGTAGGEIAYLQSLFKEAKDAPDSGRPLINSIVVKLSQKMVDQKASDAERDLFWRASAELKRLNDLNKVKPTKIYDAWASWEMRSSSGNFVSLESLELEKQQVLNDDRISPDKKDGLMDELEKKRLFAELHNYRLKIESGLDALDITTEQSYVDNMGERMRSLSELRDAFGTPFADYLSVVDVAFKKYAKERPTEFNYIHSGDFQKKMRELALREFLKRNPNFNSDTLKDKDSLEYKHFGAFMASAVDLLVVTGQVARVTLQKDSVYDDVTEKHKYAFPLPKDGVRGDVFRLPLNWLKVNSSKVHPSIWRGTEDIHNKSKTFYEWLADEHGIGLHRDSELSAGEIESVVLDFGVNSLDFSVPGKDMNMLYKEWYTKMKGAMNVAKMESDFMVAPSKVNEEAWLENKKLYPINGISVDNELRVKSINEFVQWVVDKTPYEAVEVYKLFDTEKQFEKYREAIKKSDTVSVAVGNVDKLEKAAVELFDPIFNLRDNFNAALVGFFKSIFGR
jgi:hypothetical protein